MMRLLRKIWRWLRLPEFVLIILILGALGWAAYEICFGDTKLGAAILAGLLACFIVEWIAYNGREIKRLESELWQLKQERTRMWKFMGLGIIYQLGQRLVQCGFAAGESEVF